MSYFKANMHQIRFPLGEFTTLPAHQTPSWISGVFFDGEGEEGKGREGMGENREGERRGPHSII